MPKLQQLDLSGVNLNPKLAETIFTSSYFKHLKVLDLTSSNLDDNSFAFLDNSTLKINTTLQQFKIGIIFVR